MKRQHATKNEIVALLVDGRIAIASELVDRVMDLTYAWLADHDTLVCRQK
jgi:hypothetical protein